MKEFINRSISFFSNMESKIAFYPTLIAFFGILLSFFMLSVDQSNKAEFFDNNLKSIALKNTETALTILSVCASGIISMMVFSFSMVMLLLSQASNNFSPRLLPGLISERKHQLIIGVYLATTIYCILIILSIKSIEDEERLPALSLLLGIFLTIFCIGLFIYFIHNISQRIQINRILENIYSTANKSLERVIKKEGETINVSPLKETTHWHTYVSTKNGYFQNISLKNIMNFCVENDTKIRVLNPQGLFITKGKELFSSEKELDKKEAEKVLSNFNFSDAEFVADNYVLSYKQITEIAIKAMSPGINDPGTAINAIDYLSVLFCLRMLKKDISTLCVDEKALVKLEEISFSQLLYNVMASFRTYCKHDPVICQKLFLMLLHLKESPACDASYYNVIKIEAENLQSDCLKVMNNEIDRETITKLYKAVIN